MTRLREHAEEVVTGAPAWHELCFGVRQLPPSARRTRLEHYLSSLRDLPVLPYDVVSAECHAQMRADLRQRGLKPAWFDGQLAAIALVNRLVLVTRNISEFKHFPDLRLENWFSS